MADYCEEHGNVLFGDIACPDCDAETEDTGARVPALSRPTHAPTALQQQGIDWLCARVEAGESVSALTGYAGTGKTTVIPHLRTRLLEMGRSVTLAAPTHRAAAVLRSKGLPRRDGT